MSSEEGAANWRDAQSICFSIPLIPAALQQLRFLSQVDLHRCLYRGPAVSRAIQRYEECWLPLLAASQVGLTGDEGLPLQPPLDCAWIWHCHRLSPTAYAQDCEAIYGRVLLPAASSIDADDERAMESTHRLWKGRFPQEPYTLDLTQFQYDQQWKPPKQGESSVKYNLREAAARQSAFYYQVCRPHMKDEKYLRGAEQRYKGFLHLYILTENKLFLVPTYDIDLLWHAHQLNVKAYTDDMRRILDRLLPHDDSVADRTPGSRLEKSSILTHKLWLERYGMPYIREGAMYRGEPPASVPIPLQGETVTSLLPDIEGSFRYTAKESREVMQVTLTIVRARDLPMVARKSTVRVRLRMGNKCRNFRAESSQLDCGSVWNYTLRFEAERTTGGLILEVLQKRYNTIKQKISGSKVLGRMVLPWESLMQSSTLCLDDWFELSSETQSTTKSLSRMAPAPSLFISLSWTPPQLGPHLFHIIESAPINNKLSIISDKSAVEDECWMTRTVLDQADREVFVIRARYKEDRGCMQVHEGGWVKEKSTKRILSDKIAFSAQQCDIEKQGVANHRLWRLFDSDAELSLVVRSVPGDQECRRGLVLELEANNLQTQVVLACGRRLEYEVNGVEEEEAGFVTVVRHNLADSPQGRATALLNWKTGTMEVSAEENVAFVLLLSNVIALSVLDMKGLETTARLRKISAKKKKSRLSDEWGSIIFEDTCASTSQQRSPYQYWWKASPNRGAPSSLEGNWINENSTSTIIRGKIESKSRANIAYQPKMLTTSSAVNQDYLFVTFPTFDVGGGNDGHGGGGGGDGRGCGGGGCGGCGGGGDCGGCGGCGG